MSFTPHHFYLLKIIAKKGFLFLEKLGYSKEDLEKLFTSLEEKGYLMKVKEKIELTPKLELELELQEKREKGEWISKEEKSKISEDSKNTLYLP